MPPDPPMFLVPKALESDSILIYTPSPPNKIDMYAPGTTATFYETNQQSGWIIDTDFN